MMYEQIVKIPQALGEERERTNEESRLLPPRIGFLKGQISVPPDFDALGQDEIAILFGEKP